MKGIREALLIREARHARREEIRYWKLSALCLAVCLLILLAVLYAH